MIFREYYALAGVEHHASYTEIRITPDFQAVERDSLAYVKHLNFVFAWIDANDVKTLESPIDTIRTVKSPSP